MRRGLGALAAAAVVVALLVPPAGASTATGCKGRWTDAGVCSFTYDGGGFTISATAKGGDPVTTVTVQLEAQGPVEGTKILLMSCGVTVSDGPATCGGSSAAGAVPYQPRPGDELICTVLGHGYGKFRCSAGT
jgi:hypothetical protein